MPSLVVLHHTAMASAEAALARLCDPASEVSAHYLIGRRGELWQMVGEDHRAWHAGAGCWAGKGDVNSRSIGIELDNDGTSPFAEPQMTRLEALLGDILTRRAIPPEAVIAHSDMAPGRKRDPGPRFDWARLARRGLARAAGADAPDGAADAAAFRRAAQAMGYPADIADDLLLDTVRLRYRPWARGPLDARDMALVGPAPRRERIP